MRNGKTTVLVVEDDPDTRELHRRIFAKNPKYEVFAAETIEIAIDKFGYDFDIVLCDHLTGGAGSGQALQKLLAGGGKPKQFWVVTGNPEYLVDQHPEVTGVIEKPAFDRLMAIAEGEQAVVRFANRLIA